MMQENQRWQIVRPSLCEPDSARRASVIVCDPDPVQRDALRWLLVRNGFQVHSVGTAAAVLEKAVGQEIDVVVSEVDLPDLDGLQLCRRLRAIAPVSAQVVLLASSCSGRMAVKAVDAGCIDHLTKPVDMDLLVAKVRMAADMRRSLRAMHQRATVDPLTGVGGRLELAERGAALIALAKRYGTPFCALLADADRFKSINDRWGHDVGDKALCEIVDRLSSALRASDEMFRFGGDEFCVLTPQTSASAAPALAKRMIASARSTPWGFEHRRRRQRCELSLSVGYAEWRAGEDLEDLLGRADQDLVDKKRGLTDSSSEGVIGS